MPCFVVSEAIHFYIRKLAKTEWVVIVSSIIAFVFGLLAHKMGILNFGMINRAFVVQLYFLLGYVFRMHEDWFVRQSWFIMSIGIVFYLGLGILSYFVFPNRSLDVHMNEYYNLPLCITMIVLGNLLLFSVFNKANIKNRVLEFLGQNTLLYYVWHGYAIAFLSLVLSYCDITLEINWWTAIIKTFWACLVCGVCAMIVNKYLPWVVGKKRIIKNG